jgi:hypothetical protein
MLSTRSSELMDQSWKRLRIWRIPFFSHLSNSAVVKLFLTLSPNVVPTRAHSLMPGAMTALMFFWRVDGVFFFDNGFSTAATVSGESSCPSFSRDGRFFPFTTADRFGRRALGLFLLLLLPSVEAMGVGATRDTALDGNDDATDGRVDAGGRATEVTDDAAATTVVAPVARRGGEGGTRPSTGGTSTTGRDARRASRREAGRSDAPQRDDFLLGDPATRSGVACRMAGLFWDVAASRYDRRRPHKGEAGPGGTAFTEETAGSDGRGDGTSRRGSGGEGGGGGRVMAMLLGA